MVDLTKHTQVFNLKKTSNNYYQLSLARKIANSQNLALKAILQTAQDFSPWEIVPALPGLVPLGSTPFYSVPNDPAAPDDCELFPNSPFCGGNPFSFTPIGIEPAIVLDNCNIGIQLTPVLFFIQLPPVQIVYRSNAPECNLVPATPPTSVPPKGFCFDFSCFGNGKNGILTVYFSGTATPSDSVNDFLFPGYRSDVSGETAAGDYEPYSGKTHPYFGRPDYVILSMTTDASGFTKTRGNHYKYFELDTKPLPLASAIPFNVICMVPIPAGDAPGIRPDGSVQSTPSAEWRIDFKSSLSQVGANYSYVLPFFWLDDFAISFACELVLPPPPPPIMQCCPPPFDPALLTLILANQEKIMKTIGVEEYPVTLPSSLITTFAPDQFLNPFDDNSIGAPEPPDDTAVPSLTRLIGQFIKYFDEVAGQWQVPIEVKDSDPLTPGEQPVGIKLPNIAEYAAESFLLQFRGAIDQATMLNMMTRILIEVGQIKQQDYRAYGLLQTLADYLGFDYSETQKDLPLSFDPTKESLDELLKEIVVKVPYPEYKEKHDFRTDLRRIMEAVSMIKAQYWQKVPGGNSAEGMKAHIMKTIKDRAKQIKQEQDRNSDDFDAFVKDVEDGFPTTPGVTDPTQPYGKPYAQRPEVKKLKES